MKSNRLLCLFAIALASSLSVLAAPNEANQPAFISAPNDDFANRTVLTGNAVVVTGDNSSASSEAGEPIPSGPGGGHSLWWTWTAPSTGVAVISTVGSSFDTVLGVYTGTVVSNLTLVAHDDDSGGSGTSLVTFNATAGVVYQIQVNGYDVTSFGGLVVNIVRGALAAVPNDQFAHRTTITGSSATVYGYNFAATKEPGEPNLVFNGGGASVWWSWKAPATGTVTMSTVGSTFDTILGVYTGSSVTNLTLVASDNNTGVNFTSVAIFNVTAGTTYQIAVDGLYGNMGNITLAVSLVPNDLFANRIQITGATAHVTGNNATATTEAGEPAPVGNAGGKSVWWTWKAPGNGSVTIDTSGSSFPTVLGVYTGASVTNLTMVAEDDNSAPDRKSLVQFDVVSNQVFQIMVNTISNAVFSGDIALNIKFVLPPANDAFARRTAMAGASRRVTGSNLGATKELGEPNHAGNAGGHSVWWTWTAPSSGTFTLSTFGSQDIYGDDLDTLLAVYTGTSVTNLAPVASNDDFAGYFNSAVTFAATAGTVYQIAVDGKNGKSGSIVLTVTTAPSNDQFARRITLSGRSATASGNNTGAGKETGEPNHPDSTGGASLWWTWTAPAGGPVIIDTAGSSFDTILAVYTGTTVSNLTLINSDDDGGPGPTSSLTINATAGTAYQIMVDGYDGFYGPIKLNIRSGIIAPMIKTQTGSVQADLNTAVTFSVGATGTLPLTYQWRKNGSDILGATKATLALAHVQFSDAGSYVVDVQNPAGSAVTSNAVLVVVTETVKPTVTITAGPAANARITNANVLFQGTAADNKQVARVRYSLNGSGFLDAAGRTTWFASLALSPGTNIFTVKSVDASGNESLAVTRSFVLTMPITLLTNLTSMGTITRSFTGNYLEVGHSYTVTAVAKPGFLFSNWSGTISSGGAALVFTMQPGMALQANFVPNPFIPYQGVYSGLFYDSGNEMSASSGFLTMNLGLSGSYSGKIIMNTGTHPFSGAFDLLGDSQSVVTRTGTNPVTLMLPDLFGATGSISGSLSNADWLADSLTVDLEPFNATTNKATNYAGKYTFAIQGGDPATYPGGWGYATLTVDLAGKVTMIGKLADGTPISQSASLSSTGQWPLYNSLYGSNGCIVASINFVNLPADLLSGNLGWFKPAIPSATFYPDSYIIVTPAVGSSFKTPVSASTPLLNFSAGNIVFSGGNLTGNFTNSVQNAATVTVTGPNHVIVNLNRVNGLVTGSFVHPVTLATTQIYGVVLQTQGLAVGYFFGTNQIGGFQMQSN